MNPLSNVIPISSEMIADERKAQAIVRNATAAYRSSLQDAMLLTTLRGNALAEILLMLDDLVPNESFWDGDIHDLRRGYR